MPTHTFYSPLLSIMANARPEKTKKYIIEDLLQQADRDPDDKDELYLKAAELIENDSYYLIRILMSTAPCSRAFRLAASKLARYYPVETPPAGTAAPRASA